MDKQNFYDLNFNRLKNFLIEKVNVDENKDKQLPTTPIRDIELGILKEDEVREPIESEQIESEQIESEQIESEQKESDVSESDESNPKVPEESDESEESELEKDTQAFLKGIVDKK